jgi:hypothetical protein
MAGQWIVTNCNLDRGVMVRHLSSLLPVCAGTAPLPAGYNPATWMLEVTGGAMATLIPANTSVDWPAHYMASSLALENAQRAEGLVQQVRVYVTAPFDLQWCPLTACWRTALCLKAGIVCSS